MPKDISSHIHISNAPTPLRIAGAAQAMQHRPPRHSAPKRVAGTLELPPMPALTLASTQPQRTFEAARSSGFPSDQPVLNRRAFAAQPVGSRPSSVECRNGRPRAVKQSTLTASKLRSSSRSLGPSAASSTEASTVNSSCTQSTVASVASSPRPTVNLDFDQEQLRRVLDCLLPVRGAPWSAPEQVAASPRRTLSADEPAEGDSVLLSSPFEEVELDQTPVPPKPKSSRFLKPPPPSAAPKQSWNEDISPSVSSSSSGSPRSSRGKVKGINIRTCGSNDSDFSVHSFTGGAQPSFGNGARAVSRLRERLLERFRSLHDAFGDVNRLTLMERLSNADLLRSALLSHLGGPGGLRAVDDCDDMFAALSGASTREDRGVSLADVWDALVSGSPETLLWEMRCRLVFAGICPHNHRLALQKATQLVQRQRESRSKKASWRRLRRPNFRGGSKNANGSGEDSDAASRSPMLGCSDSCEGSSAKGHSRLDHGDWLRFCFSLGLRSVEAERLFVILVGGDPSGIVDLPHMFATLRVTVAPDVSLERFATRVLDRYGSPAEAFDTVCSQRDRVMRWGDFQSLAEAIDVKDQNALELWTVLTSGTDTQDEIEGYGFRPWDHPAEPEDIELSLPERAFTDQLLVWAPDTALGALRIQLCEHFGDLAQCRRGLEQRGLSKDRALTPDRFRAKLESVGVLGCDTRRILGAVPAALHVGDDDSPRLGSASRSRVTLGDLFEALSDTQWAAGSGRPGACTAVRDGTTSLWQQLQEVQEDLSQGANGECSRPATSSFSGRQAGRDRVAPRRLEEQHQRSAREKADADPKRRYPLNPITPMFKAVVRVVRGCSSRLPSRGRTPRSAYSGSSGTEHRGRGSRRRLPTGAGQENIDPGSRWD